MLGVEKNEVILVPYDKAWNAQYRTVREEIQAILGDNALDIRHIGSTSIKGIWAKPILDAAVIVRSMRELNTDGMILAGYDACGESGVPGRCLFVKRLNGHISTHHIHCYERDNANLQAVLMFRDYLDAHHEYIQQYSDLKKKLADKYPKDRVAYTVGKEPFIKMICEMAKNGQ